MNALYYRILLTFFCCTFWIFAQAQPQNEARIYTEEHPLVYEDVWDLWPYVFLDDTGEPVGYNIDLLELIFKKLGIPYRIELKPIQDALEDLKTGRSDLMCGMDRHLGNECAPFGNSVIQIFTHSVIHDKDEETYVKSIDDLATQKVFVHENSITQRIMEEKGWSKNARYWSDMQEAVQYAHSHPESQIIGNTLSMKWLIRKFGYRDLVLTPINVPNGEYKFMSKDTRLLEQIDSIYTWLNATGRLQPIQRKWFYPELRDSTIPSWMWYSAATLLFFIIVISVYYVFSRRYERKMTENVMRSNDRLQLILNTSKVHIWLFDISKRTITSLDAQGKKTVFPMGPNFEQHNMLSEDFRRLSERLGDIAAQRGTGGTLELQAFSEVTQKMRIFSLDFSVLRRDKNGNPTIMVGASTDITEARQRQKQQKDTMLRYQHIFNSALIDTVTYDENGILDDMNEKTAMLVPGGKQSIIDKHISIQKMLGDNDISFDNTDYTYMTQIYRSDDDDRPMNKILKRDELYYEYQLIPVRDDEGHLIGIYGTGRDVTEMAKSYSRLKEDSLRLQKATDELQDYMRNIDYVLKNGGIRVVNYSPDTHMLTIYNEIKHVQQQLTQTRLLSLVAKESSKTAQRLLNNMDDLTTRPIKATIKSNLRIHGKQLCLYLSFVPTFDAEGRVTNYFGMCRDISDFKATEKQLALETKKAQEVEMVKNAFLHNMCYEIRIPLNSVVGFAKLLEKEHNADDEQIFIREIKKNSHSLLKLVNDILYLSRLDAGMIEFKTAPVDLVTAFEERCKAAWEDYKQPGVDYLVDSPYEHIVLDIDLTNLGIVIDHIVNNAAQHTTTGFVRAGFDYNGEDLTITIHDTGCGIPADQQEKIFERFVTIDSDSSGLGLPICQEVVKLMGGRIHLQSEVGKGTIVWIIIPCTCTEVTRKGLSDEN